jgi:hypothetical protein
VPPQEPGDLHELPVGEGALKLAHHHPIERSIRTLRRSNSAAAPGRRSHETRREQPTSKNSAVIVPCPATRVAAISRCHARDVTGSWYSAVDVRP